MSLAEDEGLRKQFRRANFGAGLSMKLDSAGAMNSHNQKTSLMSEEEARQLENEGSDPVELCAKAAENGSVDLDLSFFKLKELPSIVCDCSMLKILNAERNFLCRLPADLGRMSRLTKLVLQSNRLTEIPPSLACCDSLEHLDLTNNQLTTLPDELEDLAETMRYLSVDYNYLDQVPPCIMEMVNLEKLYLVENSGLSSLPPADRWRFKKLDLYMDNSQELASAFESLQASITPDSVSVTWNRIWPDKVEDSLYLGSLRAVQNASVFSSLNITYVLSCGRNLRTNIPPGVNHLTLEVDDNESETLNLHFLRAIDFVERGMGSGGAVLVHCFAGVSRSATIVVAYLMKQKHMRYRDALAFVQQQRPAANPNPNFRKQLEDFESMCLEDDKKGP